MLSFLCVAKLASVQSGLHFGAYLVQVPRLKIMRVHADIDGQRRRIVFEVAVRMAVEMPDATRRMMPDAHSVVTEYDPLSADSDLGQLTPATERAFEVAKRPVVISFDKVNVTAHDAITVLPCLFWSINAEVAQKVQVVILSDPPVQVREDSRIHLAG